MKSLFQIFINSYKGLSPAAWLLALVMLINRTGAIIIAPSVNVKKTPAKTSVDLFLLHEGTRVDITDKAMKGWREIKVGDGREGWIETKAIEEI